jgi:ABC-type polysaccharide/polyol phosphate export permease
MLNPVGAILESINAVVILHQPPNMIWLAYSAVSSVSALMFGWIVFHRAEFMFAERI